MDLLLSISDNLTELLVKILRFTQLRRALLYQNMHNTRTPGFMPQDMPVLEFVHALNGAIAEHVRNHRLLFCDTENIKFGPDSTMVIRPQPDPRAKTLLEQNRDEYIEFEVGKLLENSLNRKIAKELLAMKCGTPWTLAGPRIAEIVTPDGPLEDSSTPRETTD
jgi:flagellar basal body rod protein FlgB